MLRLTFILLAGLFALLSVAGRDINVPAGIDVARDNTDHTDPGANRLVLADRGPERDRAVPAASGGAGGVAEARGEGEPAVVNAERVNLRSGPSTATDVLDQVVRDQRVRILETDEMGWSRVSVPESGLEAWIFGSFLSPLG